MNTYCITIVICLIPLSGASESGIVGGKIAKPHSRKYMASLQTDGNHFCGGFLIRDDFVLTAAHCKRDKTVIVLGAHNITKPEKSQQKIQVKKYFPHPKYDEKFDFDIMLLELKQKAQLNEFVQTIGLPKKDKTVKAHTECTVTGWGRMQPTQNSAVSDVLREAQEKIQFNFECKKIWEEHFNTKHMICTKFNKNGGSMCQGDSGGPLICKNKPLGISAFTSDNDCTDPKYPHSYTKISSFLPWIEHITGGLGNESKPSDSKYYNHHFN
ncbi:granzyme B-like isoform X3 [Periophthalmus magnuspinnatus]|uniref:granzyme B-like isoform X3 n=1 Tax=Periophthalmus magnuspinnatus TaxID=409849 RepID=UPI00243678AA|nr:granzyme B-like isoform X3 [Periophthalmus magnuspinnatus]